MKKHLLLAAVAFFLSMGALFAQAPNGFNYQGVARDATGQALAGQAITLRLVIRNATATGTVLYTENHSVTTNTYGLYNVTVGDGTPALGTFSGINWGSGDKYLQVRIDPNGGTTYTTVGTSQLLSVPYALYAKEVAPKPVIAFRAIEITASVIPSNQIPIFNNEVFDESNNFDVATSEFTAPEDGIYHFEFSASFAGESSYTLGYNAVGFYLNNNSTSMTAMNISTIDFYGGTASMTIKLSQGDKISPRVYVGSNSTTTFSTAGNYSNFSGYKVN